MWHEVRNGIFFFSLWHHVGLKVFNSGAFQDRGLGMLNPYFLNVTIWMSHRTPYSINPNMKMYFCFSRLTIQFVFFSLSLSHVHPCSHAISPPGLSVHNLNGRRLPALPAIRGQLTWVVPAPTSTRLPELISLICNVCHNSSPGHQSFLHRITPSILAMKD